MISSVNLGEYMVPKIPLLQPSDPKACSTKPPTAKPLPERPRNPKRRQIFQSGSFLWFFLGIFYGFLAFDCKKPVRITRIGLS